MNDFNSIFSGLNPHITEQAVEKQIQEVRVAGEIERVDFRPDTSRTWIWANSKRKYRSKSHDWLMDNMGDLFYSNQILDDEFVAEEVLDKEWKNYWDI